MPSKLNRWALAALLVFAAAAVACSGGEDEAAQAEAEKQAALEEIQQQKQALDELRAEIAAAEAAAAAGDEEAGDGEDGAETDAEAEATAGGEAADLPQLQAEFEESFSELHASIGRYFQEVDPLVEGEAPNERQMAVLRINSDEAIVNAQDYITEGGDYRGAINALNAALATDPDNADLQRALAEAEENRYMTEERFSVVEKGMTQAEVRAAIGIPHYTNRRTFENGAEGWFFPVNPEGSAAGVYFEERGGEMVAFRVNFEEVVAGDDDDDA